MSSYISELMHYKWCQCDIDRIKDTSEFVIQKTINGDYLIYCSVCKIYDFYPGGENAIGRGGIEITPVPRITMDKLPEIYYG